MSGSIDNSETRGAIGIVSMENGARREIRRNQKSMSSRQKRKKVGFGEHAGKTYGDVLTTNPKYAEYLLAEGHQDHLEVQKSATWIKRGEIAIEKEVLKTGASNR